MLDNYNIRDDYCVERYFEEKDLSDFTEETYEKDLIKFCKAVNKPLKDIIDDCKAQQEIETEEILSSTNDDGIKVVQKRVKKFDVDGSDSLVLQYFKQFEEYCKSRGNKNTTINSGLDTIRAVLSKFKVELPNFPNLPDDTEDWEVLSKEDFKFILADSSLMHKSLILFMLSTGFRIYDCLNLTIGEYMEATSDFHDFVEIDDFIDNAPDDMRGYWNFEPHKTEKKHTLCRTFNSEESNKFILQNLRRLKNEYMPRKSERIKKELKLNKSDSLFGSKRGYYKKSPTVQSISTMFGRKNKELYTWHINKINHDIKEGKISAEDYDKYVDLIPKFHPHACRKYFCTMIERHTANERRYRLMEGHAPKNKLDKSYVDISKDEIKEVYDEAIIDLSVYLDENEDIEKLRDDFNQQLVEERIKHEEEKEEYRDKITELETQLEQTNKTVEVLDKKIEQSTTNIPFHEVRDIVISYLLGIDDLDNDRSYLLNLMVLDYAKTHPNEFKTTPEYLYDLIRKFDIQIELSNKDILEQTNEIREKMEYEEIDPLMIIFIDNLLSIIKDNEGVMKRIGDVDMIKFDYVAEEYLVKLDIDYNNVSEEDKIQIANEILIKYLES